MRAALPTFGRALRQAALGRAAPIDLLTPAGVTLARMDVADWSDPLAGDDAMLDACTGATLDVGCGPGRLVAELHRRQVPALGIDISEVAVGQARERGAPAVVCDVFEPVPGGGTWQHVLLADGNIGIGGDPVRLLRRCLELTADDGTVVVETGPPGTGSWRGQVRLRHGAARSPLFWWAAVDADDLAAVADRAGGRVLRMWTVHERAFAEVGEVPR
ncbi:class I SAM-dependent methyltransferase [Allorhizocola rhizosphaerae]|uniref:class I SAM-dependent methyltransferase n=1 Tax=Allorhizocola rhizosphaerae TaxID=1872709 RepID=UPI001FE726E1|nr:class I SAM-dependent methyltransferase [Allorhizocola rhizosphaerae]